MKKCPFCAEEIQDEAIKCKYCWEFISELKRPVCTTPPPLPTQPSLPWYFRTTWIIIVLLSFPPLALPQIIWHPKLPLIWKIVSCIGILLISIGIFIAFWVAWPHLVNTYNAYKDAMEMLNSR